MHQRLLAEVHLVRHPGRVNMKFCRASFKAFSINAAAHLLHRYPELRPHRMGRIQIRVRREMVVQSRMERAAAQSSLLSLLSFLPRPSSTLLCSFYLPHSLSLHRLSTLLLESTRNLIALPQLSQQLRAIVEPPAD